MAITLARSGNASATWLIPAPEGLIYITQDDFALLPESRIKSMLTAEYPNIEAFIAAFGGDGGTAVANGLNIPNAPSGAFPANSTGAGFSFSVAGFEGRPTLVVDGGFQAYSPDSRAVVTVSLGYSASK